MWLRGSISLQLVRVMANISSSNASEAVCSASGALQHRRLAFILSDVVFMGSFSVISSYNLSFGEASVIVY